MTWPGPGLLAVALLLAGHLLFRVVAWVHRIRRFRKSMPVVPVLFPETSIFRILWPQRWQTWHRDWHMRQGRASYRQVHSDVFALVSLFETDSVITCNPHALYELTVAGFSRFQMNLKEAELVPPSSFDGALMCTRSMCTERA